MKLSICIATYNRARCICDTLDSIIPQLTDDVEIVIADGASYDTTDLICRRYAEQHKNIKYHRLPVKGGVDQDYDKVVELAQGEYCWLFTDDDIMEADAVEAVLKAINNGHSLVVVNYCHKNETLTKALEEKSIPVNCDTPCYYLNDLSEFIYHLSYIGCVVIKRDLWLSRERKKYYGSEFIHVGVIFQSELPAGAYVIAKPYISLRTGGQSWESRRFEVWMVKWPKLIASFSAISDSLKVKYSKSNFTARIKDYVSCRSMGGYNMKEFFRWIKNDDLPVSLKLAAFIVVIMPKMLIKAGLYVYRRGNVNI